MRSMFLDQSGINAHAGLKIIEQEETSTTLLEGIWVARVGAPCFARLGGKEST